MPTPVTNNPFAVLTAVVAPAILTNACTVLSLGTGNRIARVVDRTRQLVAEIGSAEPGTPAHQSRVNQIERLQVRAQLLLRALQIFYASLGAFAASALISVVGSALAFYEQEFAFHAAAIAGLATGAFGVSGLVLGCVIMVRETRVAIRNLAEEAALSRTEYHQST